jgi:class 3 adenylate cyclase/tetratricopeptide (TPR) repeat protein
MKCPRCFIENPEGFQFCGHCGDNLSGEPAAGGQSGGVSSERKHVTVVFSDLSAYSTLAGSIDPEDLKGIMGEIFSRGAGIVQKYGGAVERFFGDEIMAVFGHPAAHEDDAVRAIHAARDIHRAVIELGQTLQGRIGMPLMMHSGINSGIVITDANSSEAVSCGLTGDPVNLARRFQGLAQPGDILVGRDTYRQALGHFSFERLEKKRLKGKTEPISMYRVLGTKQQPRKIHRQHGRRAPMVGRGNQLGQLLAAAADLRGQKGRVISIFGEAGTGKSRLVEEFRNTLDLDTFHWCEGYAYSYAENISYFPYADLLRRRFGFCEDDDNDVVNQRIHSGLRHYVADPDAAQYIGRLYSVDLNHGEIDPEYWKQRFQRTLQEYFSAQALERPLIVCIEDLHWADPSTITLTRTLLAHCDYPALFLLTYRPSFQPQRHQLFDQIAIPVSAVQLAELTPSDSRKLVRSLLDNEKVPQQLERFVEKNIQGNPFFLEEIINALIETQTLVPSTGGWRLAKSIRRSDAALTINGVITGRLDRLSPEQKLVLKEASVIGSSFHLDILQQLSSAGDQLTACLESLEQLDLIRTKSRAPVVEFSFKHVLIREVVYSGLLKSERQAIHERIGRVIEEVFRERLAEYYETLGYHFKWGNSRKKAVSYLIQSGRKSLQRYAVEESHQYYLEAYELLTGMQHLSPAEEKLLVEVIVYWFPVFYYRGRFLQLEGIMEAHLELAETVADKELLGKYCVGVGMCYWAREKYSVAYAYFHRAVKIGQEIGSRPLTGMSFAWLPWVCVEMGRFDEAIGYAREAEKLAPHIESDHYPYYNSLDAYAYAYWAKGDSAKVLGFGDQLLAYGNQHSNVRATTWGHFAKGWGYHAAGDFAAAIDSTRRAIAVSADPFYTQIPKLFLGMCYVADHQIAAAKPVLVDISEHGRRYGCETLGSCADMLLAVVCLSEGHLRKGVEQIRALQRMWKKNDAEWRVSFSSLLMSEIYQGMVQREVALAPLAVFRNLSFLLTTFPFCSNRAEQWYRRTLDISRQIGAMGIEGQVHMGLGRLYLANRKKTAARHCLAAAEKVFKKCQATAFLRRLAALHPQADEAGPTPDGPAAKADADPSPPEN